MKQYAIINKSKLDEIGFNELEENNLEECLTNDIDGRFIVSFLITPSAIEIKSVMSYKEFTDYIINSGVNWSQIGI